MKEVFDNKGKWRNSSKYQDLLMFWLNFLGLPFTHPFSCNSKGRQEQNQRLGLHSVRDTWYLNRLCCISSFWDTWMDAKTLFTLPYFISLSNSGIVKANSAREMDTNTFSLETKWCYHPSYSKEDKEASIRQTHDLMHSTTQWNQVFNTCVLFMPNSC